MTTPSTVRHQFVLGARIARAWARLYTRGLDPGLRDRRREELNADLWDHQTDARARGESDAMTSAAIVLRSVRGAIDDVRWRQEAASDGLTTRTERPLLHASTRIRWLALAGMAGGLGGAAFTLLGTFQWWRYRTHDVWFGTVSGAFYWTAYVLGVLGLVALHSLQREREGRVGRLGFELLILAFVLAVGSSVLFVRTVHGSPPWSAAVALVYVRPFLTIVGWFLFGIGTIRAGLLPSRFIRLPLALGFIGLAQIASRLIIVTLLDKPPFGGRDWERFLYEGLALASALLFAGIGYAVWSVTADRNQPTKTEPVIA